MKLPYLLSLLLRPLGLVYGLILALRRQAWETDILSRLHVDLPVVSVGNIALGGTGKTPMVDWLMGWCSNRGLRIAVLSRGYGGAPPEMPYLVDRAHSPKHSGDEPLQLARAHPEARVLVDRKRTRAASWAKANTEACLYLMDDGFQHVALARDVDIVLLRPEDLASQWNAVLPSGPWREGKTALKRATIFGMKIEPLAFERLTPLIERRLGRYGKPIFSFSYKPAGLFGVEPSAPDETPLSRPNLDGAPYILITGVGNPDHVRATAGSLLGPATAHARFADHHPFSSADVDRIAARHPGLPIVCTVKDAMKLSRALMTSRYQPKAWALDINMAFGPAIGVESFPAWWEETARALLEKKPGATCTAKRAV